MCLLDGQLKDPTKCPLVLDRNSVSYPLESRDTPSQLWVQVCDASNNRERPLISRIQSIDRQWRGLQAGLYVPLSGVAF